MSRGRVSVQGGSQGDCPPPRYNYVQAVFILPECILVCFIFFIPPKFVSLLVQKIKQQNCFFLTWMLYIFNLCKKAEIQQENR